MGTRSGRRCGVSRKLAEWVTPEPSTELPARRRGPDAGSVTRHAAIRGVPALGASRRGHGRSGAGRRRPRHGARCGRERHPGRRVEAPFGLGRNDRTRHASGRQLAVRLRRYSRNPAASATPALAPGRRSCRAGASRGRSAALIGLLRRRVILSRITPPGTDVLRRRLRPAGGTPMPTATSSPGSPAAFSGVADSRRREERAGRRMDAPGIQSASWSAWPPVSFT